MQEIFDLAQQAAKSSIEGMADDPYAFDCGFAWVTISGNSAFARWCRKQLRDNGFRYDSGGNFRTLSDSVSTDWSVVREMKKYGAPGYPKGWQFWNPGDYSGQSMTIKSIAAQAFARVLRENGVECSIGERLD